MKARLLAIASTMLAVSAATPCAAQETLIAGWDFSQYFGDGYLSIDGVGYQSTLSANYSDLDPTFGAGAESAAFGTLYFDGQFGSTAVSPTGLLTEEFLPTSGSLTSNSNVPNVGFDAFTVLLDEGQLFANQISMVARNPVTVVFRADMSSDPETGNWVLSFGGTTFEGTSTVEIQFSGNGGGYTTVGSVDLDANDSQVIAELGPATVPTVFVRLSFSPLGNAQPIIDNVAISVPELGANAQAGVALAVLLGCARRRAA